MREVQIWQHRTSGERYIVAIEAGMVIEAAGPLHHSEFTDLLYHGFNDDPEVTYDLNSNPDDYILLTILK
jgi:hypothetical protein